MSLKYIPKHWGGGIRPPNDLLQQMATQAYSSQPAKHIGDFTLLKQTPTLKFYCQGNTIVVAIRGTADARDAVADAMLAFGKLTASSRYKTDLHDLTYFQKQYPAFDYYGVAHSLGSAILDEFIALGLIKSAVSYNGAIQPGRYDSPQNHRIYNENDLLYRTMGQLSTNAETRKSYSFNPFANHSLSTFQGGLMSLLEHKITSLLEPNS